MTDFPFDEAQKQAFLDRQFAAQFAHYGIHYPTCERNIVMDRGAVAGKPVTIHVESFNPALRFYQRLGFEHVDTNGVYFLMRWTPPQVKTAS